MLKIVKEIKKNIYWKIPVEKLWKIVKKFFLKIAKDSVF